MQRFEYKTNGLGFTVAANNPLVEIGSRGTVGSLVSREIEYFNKLQLNQHRCCLNSLKTLPTTFGGSDTQHQSTFLKSLSNITHKSRQVSDVASTSRPRLGSLIANPKKKRTSKLIMPSMCSMVEVAECNPPAAISRFTYRNLKG